MQPTEPATDRSLRAAPGPIELIETFLGFDRCRKSAALPLLTQAVLWLTSDCVDLDV